MAREPTPFAFRFFCSAAIVSWPYQESVPCTIRTTPSAGVLPAGNSRLALSRSRPGLIWTGSARAAPLAAAGRTRARQICLRMPDNRSLKSWRNVSNLLTHIVGRRHEKHNVRTASSVAVFLVAGGASAQSGNEARGERLFNQQCKACHTLDKDGAGPSAPTFMAWSAARPVDGRLSPSDAMKASGIVWDDKTLAEYLKDPKGRVPGTKMVYLVSSRRPSKPT